MAGGSTTTPAKAPRRDRGPCEFVVDGTRFDAPPLAPGLYIVATPIGNLEDITIRALKVLGAADEVWCEDTRITRKLFARYGLAAPLKVYNDHKAAAVRPRILASIAAGRAVALVSDAGTPLVSDPGFKLVREARAADLAVRVVPGPSALTAAASIAGVATDRLHFVGFLPSRAGERSRLLAELARIRATLVIYESPVRLAATLAALAKDFGARDAAVARELTKLHEEVVGGTLEALAKRFTDRAVKGEIVILVAPGQGEAPTSAEIDAALAAELEHGGVREAAAVVAETFGIPRREAYSRALSLRAADNTR